MDRLKPEPPVIPGDEPLRAQFEANHEAVRHSPWRVVRLIRVDRANSAE